MLQSSLKCKFLVVSSTQLVEGTAVDSSVFAKANKIVDAWAGNVVLADFEGEMPGFGGELVLAQFLATKSLDPRTLERSRAAPAFARDEEVIGLLVDLRDPLAVAIAKRVMESEDITKVIWGADGDLVSLRHQRGLGVFARNVVDCQLAFSEEDRRLGMAKMLGRVSGLELPPKAGQIDFGPTAANRRALPLPLSAKLASYSMDDLHRIESILQTQDPDVRPYAATKLLTERLIADLEEASCGLEWIRAQLYYLNRKYGDGRLQKAVNIARACRHVQIAFGQDLSAEDADFLDKTKRKMEKETDITIPDDLSFAEDALAVVTEGDRPPKPPTPPAVLANDKTAPPTPPAVLVDDKAPSPTPPETAL